LKYPEIIYDLNALPFPPPPPPKKTGILEVKCATAYRLPKDFTSNNEVSGRELNRAKISGTARSDLFQ